MAKAAQPDTATVDERGTGEIGARPAARMAASTRGFRSTQLCQVNDLAGTQRAGGLHGHGLVRAPAHSRGNLSSQLDEGDREVVARRGGGHREVGDRLLYLYPAWALCLLRRGVLRVESTGERDRFRAEQ